MNTIKFDPYMSTMSQGEDDRKVRYFYSPMGLTTDFAPKSSYFAPKFQVRLFANMSAKKGAE